MTGGLFIKMDYHFLRHVSTTMRAMRVTAMIAFMMSCVNVLLGVKYKHNHKKDSGQLRDCMYPSECAVKSQNTRRWMTQARTKSDEDAFHSHPLRFRFARQEKKRHHRSHPLRPEDVDPIVTPFAVLEKPSLHPGVFAHFFHRTRRRVRDDDVGGRKGKV